MESRPFISKKYTLFFVLLGFLAYAHTLSYPFVHDDLASIKENPHISDWGGIFSVFSQTFHPPDVVIATPFYRPLLEIFYRLQFCLFHFHAAGYHFFNIALHILNGFLVFFLVNSIVKREGFAWAVAGIFLLHPVQTEAVAAIAGVSNLMAFLFICGPFLLYLKSQKVTGRKKYFYVFLTSVLFFIGLFIKEQVLILPFIIVLYELIFLKGKTNIPIGYLGGFFICVVLYLMGRKLFLGSSFTPFFHYRHELWLRVLSIPKTLVVYTRVLVCPYDLHYYRSTDILEPLGYYPFIASGILGGSLILLKGMPSAKKRMAGFGLAWFFLTLMPVLNIVPLIHEYSFLAAFEHFLYLPMVGFFIFCFTVAEHFIDQYAQKYAGAIKRSVVFLILSLCFIVTVRQNTFWQGEIPLFQRAIKFEPNLGRLHVLLGDAYFLNGEVEESIEELREGLHIFHNYLSKTQGTAAEGFYAGFVKRIHATLASCYERLGDYKAAISQYEKIIGMGDKRSDLFNNIGMNYIKCGDFAKATLYFKKALFVNKNDVMAMSNLAGCYLKQGEKKEAVRLLREVLKSNPGFPTARKNLELLLESGF